MSITWKDSGGRYLSAQIGHLFAYIETREAYQINGHPDYAPETFEWFIAPDDEDKNYRRSIRWADQVASMDAAKQAVEDAVLDLSVALTRAVEVPASIAAITDAEMCPTCGAAWVKL